MNLEQLETFCKDVESRVQEMETMKSPLGIHGKIDYLFSEIENLTNSISEVMNKVNSFSKDDKFLELFTDSEIREMYLASALSSNQIKEYIEKNILNNKEKISMSTVSRYINGHIEDLLARSKLGRYLRYELTKKNKQYQR